MLCLDTGRNLICTRACSIFLLRLPFARHEIRSTRCFCRKWHFVVDFSRALFFLEVLFCKLLPLLEFWELGRFGNSSHRDTGELLQWKNTLTRNYIRLDSLIFRFLFLLLTNFNCTRYTVSSWNYCQQSDDDDSSTFWIHANSHFVIWGKHIK